MARAGGPFLSSAARIAETGLAIAFLKQLVTSGTEFGGAAVDAWKTPANMEHNKEIVGSVSGQFAVDMVAFTAGGYAGSKLARRFLSGHSGPVRFAEDATTAALRESSPRDSAGIRENLNSLLGTDIIGQRFNPITVPSKFGDAKITPYYSQESSALNLKVDAPRFLNQPRLEVFMDGATGLPNRIVAHNDQTHFMPSLFKEMGLPRLAEAAGKPTEFALADKFGKISYADVNAQMSRVKAQNGPSIALSEAYKGTDALYVKQKMGHSAPITTPLGTAEMGPCSALIIVDKASGRHFLAHVDHVSNPDMLAQSFKSFNLKKSDIYILEGPDNAISINGGLLGSAQRAFMAVAKQPGAAERIKFLHYAADTRNAQVVIKNGNIYAGAQTYAGL